MYLPWLYCSWAVLGHWSLGAHFASQGRHVQPKRSERNDLDQLREDYYDVIEEYDKKTSVTAIGITGAMFFVLCLGKVSEEIDFAKNYACWRLLCSLIRSELVATPKVWWNETTRLVLQRRSSSKPSHHHWRQVKYMTCTVIKVTKSVSTKLCIDFQHSKTVIVRTNATEDTTPNAINSCSSDVTLSARWWTSS